MINGRYQTLIVFSPESSSLSCVSDTLVKMFDPARFDVSVIPAVKASIADFFRSDIILLGSNDEANFSYGGFSELKESLAGVPLGGRIGAAFSSISQISIRNLDIMLKETRILMVPGSLLIRSSWDDPRTREVLREWVGTILDTLETTVGIA